METNKKSNRSKKKKSKLKVIRERLLSLKSSLSEKCRALLRLPSAAIKKAFQTFRGLPKAARVISVYVLIVGVALGVFYWRLSQMQGIEPLPAEPSFDWSAYLPQDPADSVGEPHPDDPIPEVPEEAGEGLLEEEEKAADTRPVFVRGAWPVKGDLFYGFHETVIQHGLGYPLYYTSKGIAIKAESGTTVSASWEGKVIRVMELDKPHGKSVMIAHDNGLVSYYGALQVVTVKVDDRVARGEAIGMVGAAFEAEPDYLYLEVLKDGRVVNPLDYLQL